MTTLNCLNCFQKKIELVRKKQFINKIKMQIIKKMINIKRKNLKNNINPTTTTKKSMQDFFKGTPE